MGSQNARSLGHVALLLLSQMIKQAISCVCSCCCLSVFFFLLVWSLKDPATLPGSSWLHRLQQLGLTLQLLLQGHPYLVLCGRFPSLYQKVYAATQFSLLKQNRLSADKEQPGLLCCYSPDPSDPESSASPF